MTQVKIFAWTFATIFAVLMLAFSVIPLAISFLSWDIAVLMTDQFVKIFWFVTRLWLIVSVVTAIGVSMSPAVIIAAKENEHAKAVLKAKRKLA
jgi:hypothetical protein